MFEMGSDPRATATFVAAIIAAAAGAYTAWKARKLDQLRLSLDEKQHELDRARLQAEENQRQAINERELSRSSVDMLYRELSDLRRTASILLSAIDATISSSSPLEECDSDALQAVSELSLFYPPNTPFQEELNQQLEFAAMCLRGETSQPIRQNLMAMRMIIWELVDWYMRRIKAVGGENNEDSNPPKIHKATDAPIT